MEDPKATIKEPTRTRSSCGSFKFVIKGPDNESKKVVMT